MTRLPPLPDPALTVEGNPLFNTSQMMHYGQTSHDLAAKPKDLIEAFEHAVQAVEAFMIVAGIRDADLRASYEKTMTTYRHVLEKYKN